MATNHDDLRALAVAFTTAVATAGRLADELDNTVNDLNDFIARRLEQRATWQRQIDAAGTDEGDCPRD